MEVNPLLQLLYEVAPSVARHEDAALHLLTGTGVFFMPEVAFAYAVGKEMALRASVRFPDEDVEWRRETDIGGGGATDLIMTVGEQRPLVVEFKMSQPWPKYVADVAKLKRIHDRDPEHDLAFCALVDANQEAGADDVRITEFERAVPTEQGVRMERVGPLVLFPTRSPRYSSRLTAVLGVWHVIPQNATSR